MLRKHDAPTQGTREAIFQACDNLAKNAEFKALLLGNAESREDPHRRRMNTVAIGILNLPGACRTLAAEILRRGLLLLLVAIHVGAPGAHAQNATWLASPGSGDFAIAANWSPPTVPTNTAIFGASNTTTIGIPQSVTISVGTLQFNAGAPGYSFTLSAPALATTFDINGTGVVNNSSNSPRQ